MVNSITAGCPGLVHSNFANLSFSAMFAFKREKLFFWKTDQTSHFLNFLFVQPIYYFMCFSTYLFCLYLLHQLSFICLFVYLFSHSTYFIIYLFINSFSLFFLSIYSFIYSYIVCSFLIWPYKSWVRLHSFIYSFFRFFEFGESHPP